jgi:hypothetical protein
MLTEDLYCNPRVRMFNEPFRISSATIVPFGTGDVLQDAQRRLGIVIANDIETTGCSPVIPTAELTRIRNKVVSNYTTLRNNYSNVGNSVDSTGVVAQFGAVFDAMGDGNYCYYQSDQHLIDDIMTCANGANQVLQNAFNQYTNNFATRISPIRVAYQELQSAAAAATNSVERILNAYKRLWANNFQFHLHSGVNGTLDNLLSEYTRLMEGSNTLFDQGNNRVQGNFEAEVRQSNVVFGAFGNAMDYWKNKDGDTAYGMYVDNIRMYQDSLSKINGFTVLDTPRNRQIFSEIDLHIAEVKKQFASFPNFVQAYPSPGFILDPGTSSRKFYSRQAVLNLAAAAGSHFTTQISPGKSLIGTGFSYQHGGKMPPHSEHKDGRDCDIFSEYFKVGVPSYDEAKAKKMAIFLLNNKVTRLIYTNSTVVSAANAACPSNAVAVVGSGHETHMHFDLDTATVLSNVG